MARAMMWMRALVVAIGCLGCSSPQARCPCEEPLQATQRRHEDRGGGSAEVPALVAECRVDGDCTAPDSCATGACEAGRCRFEAAPDGRSCGEESHCYRSKCMPKRECAEYCITDLTRRMSPELARISAECRNENPEVQHDCEAKMIDLEHPLFVEVQGGLDACFAACGYPVLPVLQTNEM